MSIATLKSNIDLAHSIDTHGCRFLNELLQKHNRHIPTITVIRSVGVHVVSMERATRLQEVKVRLECYTTDPIFLYLSYDDMSTLSVDVA